MKKCDSDLKKRKKFHHDMILVKKLKQSKCFKILFLRILKNFTNDNLNSFNIVRKMVECILDEPLCIFLSSISIPIFTYNPQNNHIIYL